MVLWLISESHVVLLFVEILSSSSSSTTLSRWTNDLASLVTRVCLVEVTSMHAAS